MAPAIQPAPIKDPGDAPRSTVEPASPARQSPFVPNQSVQSDDGTTQLLKWGGLTFGTGIFFAILTRTLLGGIGPQGPHTNSGWMALIITMMCLPFGFLLLLLGTLKWLRNRRRHRTQ